MDAPEAAISSLVDTWLVLRDLESNGERNRGLHILKSRGMAHSNQVREFVLSDSGIQLTDVYHRSETECSPDRRGWRRKRASGRSTRASARKPSGNNWRSSANGPRSKGRSPTLRAEFSAEEATIEHILRQGQTARGVAGPG